ncbi:hydrogenase maturation protease [Azospirillum rugosum]|uniref:Hydrogenase maturation protease n=1 Tax=Azospirillum rugosum TaxID=416170 RepID=A0ABS4SGG2_9PROT|nr:hydrogenase maturation protease [Azospirillum rugosum]MBP2291654.1 hydrogenase maturation protease [Azospirillum rugosum]MDQ0524534.1 hydrogenase maturation protease [Azospirillum rugosum]
MLILGIGNRYRSDDAVGPLVADRLAALGLPAREHSGEGAALIEAWDGADRVILVDATQSGAAPGTIRRLDAAAEPLPAAFFRYSTHRFGLAEAVETARALGRLPASLVVYGVEGRCFDFGEGLSEEVGAAVERVVSMVEREVVALGPHPTLPHFAGEGFTRRAAEFPPSPKVGEG